MYSILVILILIFSFAHARHEEYIVGGSEAVFGEFPSMLSIEYDRVHICGATIISDYWALTTASCVLGLTASNMRLVSSAVNPSTNGLLHEVQIIITHENYTATDSWNNDIALLRVVANDRFPLGFTADIAVVPAQNTTVAEGTPVTVLGWGGLVEGGPSTTILNKAAVMVSNWDSCSVTYQGMGYTLHSTQLCAAADNAGPCVGDEGGPLLEIAGDVQSVIGLVSKGYGCGRPGYPAVYTQVSAYCEWIVMTTVDPYICTI